jgi:hypothetical protein
MIEVSNIFRRGLFRIHAGSCLVDRRAMPPLTTTPSPDAERRGNGTRKLR